MKYQNDEMHYDDPCYEHDLPAYLQNDLDAYKNGLSQSSDILDCLWCELYDSLNVAELDDDISVELADYLRQKYLF